MDTEFNENGRTIDLISIALVSDDGREYYAVSSEFDEPACGPWLRQNVIPHLPDKSTWKPRAVIREEIESLLLEDKSPEIWAYFADYDWVVFCQLWGRMLDLPPFMPKWCRDLKQLMWMFDIGKNELPAQDGAEHDALADARWVRDAHQHILDVYRFDSWQRK